MWLGGLITSGGYVLIEDHRPENGAIAKTKYSASVFEQAGFAVVEEGRQLLLRHVDFPILRTIHVIAPGVSGVPFAASTQRWLEAHIAKGWLCRRWNDEQLRSFVEAVAPDFLDVFLGWKDQRSRNKAASYLILERLGGVVVETNDIFEASLDEILSGKRLAFFAQTRAAEGSDAVEESLSDRLMASVPGHAFWTALEFDLALWHRRRPNAGIGTAYLKQRIEQSVGFLAEDDHPELLELGSSLLGTCPAAVPPAGTLGAGLPLTSKLCNEADFATEWFHCLAAELGETMRYHRKLWEKCFIFQALLERGCLEKGKRGLALVTNADPLIPALAGRGCDVVIVEIESHETRRKSEEERERQLVNQSSSWLRANPNYGSISYAPAPPSEVQPIFGPFCVLVC